MMPEAAEYPDPKEGEDVLIGIDMLGVQSPDDGRGEAGRYGRQLVEALLARSGDHRFLLYGHEGLPTSRFPSARNAAKALLTPVPSVGPSGLRPTIQRLLDRNPDGLDWLILLDPFSALYGGFPPESPLNGLRVASVVLDLAPALAEGQRLVPLRRHEAVLAVSDPIAAECRKRLGSASDRVRTIDLACDPIPQAPGRSDPLTKVSGDELGRLGISGPFLFARAGSDPSLGNLDGILEAYGRLPFEHRRGHQLAIAGPVEDPAEARAILYDHGSEAGLVLVGDVPEASLLTLYARCSAFLAPSIRDGSGLAILEAMRCGAAVVAGRTTWQSALIGDAGIAADATDPAGISADLADLLDDADLGRELRRRALERSAAFPWEPAIEAVLSALEAAPAPRTRIRFDRGHLTRPRVALFLDLPATHPGRLDLPSRVPAAFREAYNIDLYLDPSHAALADGLPTEFGGFDARLFDRNDGLLSYHAACYRIEDAGSLDLRLDRIRKRPGLVVLLDDKWLDRIVAPAPGSPADPRSIEATSRLREVFLTSSRVVVHSPWHRERIAAALPEFADQLAEIPPPSAPAPISEARRARARARLDLLPDTLVIGQFGEASDLADPLLAPAGFRAIARLIPTALLLSFDGPDQDGDLGDAFAALDLAIHAGWPGPIDLIDLMRAGVATIAPGSTYPDSAVLGLGGSASPADLARAVRDLAIDAEARAALGSTARDLVSGLPDPDRAASLWVDQMERCSAELIRVPGRKPRRPSDGPRGLALTPHFHRQASAADRAATGRGEQR